MSNNNYPLDEKALEEQYADLLLKIALKEYLKEQALQMKQQEAEAAPAPQPAQKSSNVVAVAFRQVGWQEAKETLLHGLKKGVTRVAVVFLAAALTATTAFALSPVERKESILEKVINTIRNYADMLTNTSTMVEVPRYRYEEYSFIEVPNEQVQEVIDTWVIFRNSVNFTEKSGISLSAVMRAMYYYCEAKGLEYPYTDDTHTWVDAKAVQQFAGYLFGATKEHLDWEVYLEPRYYDAERDAYRDIHYEDGYPNYITIARSGLVSYTENEDGTFTIELVMEPDSDWNEYCYSPVIITADYSSGHLVLVSGTVKDMLSEAELSLTQQRLEYERINPTGRRYPPPPPGTPKPPPPAMAGGGSIWGKSSRDGYFIRLTCWRIRARLRRASARASSVSVRSPWPSFSLARSSEAWLRAVSMSSAHSKVVAVRVTRPPSTETIPPMQAAMCLFPAVMTSAGPMPSAVT